MIKVTGNVNGMAIINGQAVDLNHILLVTIGDESEGDPWRLLSIHLTRESAEIAKKQYEEPRTRLDGSTYKFNATIEQWTIQEFSEIYQNLPEKTDTNASPN